jgi:hypothetical protein
MSTRTWSAQKNKAFYGKPPLCHESIHYDSMPKRTEGQAIVPALDPTQKEVTSHA